MKRGVVIGAVVGFILLVVLIIALVARSNSPSTGEITLSVWSPFNEKKIYDQISQKFLDDNPGVKLEFRYIDAKDSQDYEAKVVNAIANGTGPDIWLIRSDWLPKHVDKSVPSNWTIGKDKLSPVDQAKQVLTPAIVDLNTYQDKLYGVPLSADSLAIIYNQDYLAQLKRSANFTDAQYNSLEAPPKTWSALKDLATLFTNRTGSKINVSGIALGTNTVFAPSDVVTAFLNQAGANILADDKKTVVFNVAQYNNGQATFPAIDALTFFTSFSDPAQVNFSWRSDMGGAIDAFINGKTNAVIGYWSTLQEIVDRKPNFEVQVFGLPQKIEMKNSTDRVDYAISWSHIVNSKSTNQKLAWDYLQYISQEKVQSDYEKATNKLSVVVRDDKCDPSQSFTSAGDAYDIYTCQFKTARGMMKPEWQQVDTIFQDMISQVTELKQAPQNSVDSAAVRFKAFINP